VKPIDIDLREPLLELIRRTSTVLAPDVSAVIERAAKTESKGSAGWSALQTVLENITLARDKSAPICQDTGHITFHVHFPFGYSQRMLTEQILDAVRTATAKTYLRPNAVDTLTGKNSGNNTGAGFPMFYFHEWEKNELRFDVMLKGGGCENVGAQYRLPHVPLGAGRDLEGVRRVILDAIDKAQGYGCGPGIIGVGIGGDRCSGYLTSKEQLARKLDDVNPNPELAALEERILKEANELGIGPMGFGGKTTIMAVKIGSNHRVPACYFVSMSYACWADRRGSLHWKNGEVTYD
jgi:fumarate hydratase class I